MPVSESYVVQYQNNERNSSIRLRKRETNTNFLGISEKTSILFMFDFKREPRVAVYVCECDRRQKGK